MREKKWHREYGATTACTLRLVEMLGIGGRAHVIVGDSWFASLKTAVALRERGMFFIGQVKVSVLGFVV
jgi:hypothetical protein